MWVRWIFPRFRWLTRRMEDQQVKTLPLAIANLSIARHRHRALILAMIAKFKVRVPVFSVPLRTAAVEIRTEL